MTTSPTLFILLIFESWNNMFALKIWKCISKERIKTKYIEEGSVLVQYLYHEHLSGFQMDRFLGHNLVMDI